jgi:hypothetical protein
MPVEDIDSARIERWRAALPSTLSPRTRNKLLIQLHGIFRRAQKVYGLPRNLMVDVERHRQRSNGDIQVFSVEEVHGLVRAAESQQDAAPFLDGSALRRRYDRALKAAGLRPLRFHDLRHTFGTRMIARADIRRVQEWMGHADIQTTMKYLHYVPRHDDAALVADAFRPSAPAERNLVEGRGVT